ncbi:MAG: TraC family protein [Anaerolineae bacterium]
MIRHPWTTEGIRALCDDGPPIADLLPWRWVEADIWPIHVLADGSLGLAWELGMADVELKEAGDLDAVQTAVQHFLHQLPVGVAFQVMLAQWPTLQPAIDAWKASRLRNPLIDRVVAAREGHLRGLTRDEFFAAKHIMLLLALRWWPPNARRRWGGALTAAASLGSIAETRDSRQAALGELGQLADTVQTLARALGGGAAFVDGPRMLEIAWRLLNPDAPGLAPKWDPWRPLNEQAAETAAVFRPDGLTLGSMEGRVISFLGLPPETRPGHLTLGAAPGAPSPLLQRPGLGWLTVSGTVMDPEGARNWAGRKRFFAWSQRFGFSGDTRVEAARIHDELGGLLERAFSEGHRLCQAAFQLVHFDRPERVQSRTEQVLGALAHLDCRAQVERVITLPAWLQSLPFGYDPRLESTSRRARRLLSPNLADLLPVYGGFKGTTTPSQLFLDRAGMPVFFDPFDSPVGMHVAISGVTGSGKSFTAIDLCLQQLSLGADVVVLDKGESYRRLAELAGGQYLSVDPDRMPTLNPCHGPGDSDHQLFVSAVLGEMASRGLERFQLDPEADGVLVRAVAEAFGASDGPAEITLSDIARILERPDYNQDGLGRRLGRMLFPFLRGGPSGRFFDGPNGFEIRPGLTVIELKDLERNPSLQTVVVMVLLHLITTFLGQRPRGQRKFLVVDEAWALLRSEYGARVLALVARTYRKLGTAAVFISQFLTDFDGPSGQAVRDNCPNRLFLRQELDALRRLQGPLGFTDRHVQALAGATNVPGRYSEALLVTPTGRTIVRIVTDPITYWVATTHPADTARWEMALAEANGRVELVLDQLVNSVAEGGPAQ